MSNAEAITASLERAEKLKEAGWPQEDAVFYWHQTMSGGWQLLTKPELKRVLTMRRVHVYFASPTAEEILRRLPNRIQIAPLDELRFELQRTDSRWRIMYTATPLGRASGIDDIIPEEISSTLANAAAACWIYLKEHSLLPND